jgi:hypothetical protein
MVFNEVSAHRFLEVCEEFYCTIGEFVLSNIMFVYVCEVIEKETVYHVHACRCMWQIRLLVPDGQPHEFLQMSAFSLREIEAWLVNFRHREDRRTELVGSATLIHRVVCPCQQHSGAVPVKPVRRMNIVSISVLISSRQPLAMIMRLFICFLVSRQPQP